MKLLLLAITVVAAGVSVSQSAYAAPTSGACFSFNSGNGTIEDYFSHQNDTESQPACPTDVQIPSTIGGVPVTKIGDYSMYYSSLTSVRVPASVTDLGTNAFANNNDLTSLTFLGQLTNVGEGVLYGAGIQTVTYDGTTYDSTTSTNEDCTKFNAGTGTIEGFYVLDLAFMVSDGALCFAGPSPIPSTVNGVAVTKIGDNAFQSIQMQNIVIPNGVTDIGAQAFAYSGATSVTLPNTLTTIGNEAFASNNLETLSIPSSVTSLGNQAFYSNQLSDLTIPSTITTFGSSVFSANRLESVTLPNGMTTIPDSMFTYNAFKNFTIPASITSIGDGAFFGNQLTSITIPNTVSSIGTNAFASNQITTVVINGSPSIGSDAFGSNPITSATLNGTTYDQSTPISEECFDFSGGVITGYHLRDFNLLIQSGVACMKLDVAVPASIGGVPVTEIGSYAFFGKQLTGLSLPNGITTIGDSAFNANRITGITLPDSLQTIGREAFNYNLFPRVDIPDSVTTIGESAFAANYEMKAITLGNSLTTIGKRAFYSSGIEGRVIIPDSVASIGESAFASNDIASVTIGDSVSFMDESAFQNNMITDVKLGSGLSAIPKQAFAYNVIKQIDLPEGVVSIGEDAFSFQSPIGKGLGQELYSSPTRQESLRKIWYTRVYTSDFKNPHDLQDRVFINEVNEATDGTYCDGFGCPEDFNGDGDTNDIIYESHGGWLINPAQAYVRYKNVLGQDVRSPMTMAGIGLSGYNAYENTSNDLARYFRVGVSQPFVAPNISNYTTVNPSGAQVVTLASASTSVIFTYGGVFDVITGPVVGAPNSGVGGSISYLAALLILVLIVGAIGFVTAKRRMNSHHGKAKV